MREIDHICLPPTQQERERAARAFTNPIYITKEDVEVAMKKLHAICKSMADERKRKDEAHIVYFEFEDGIISPRAVDGVKYKNLEVGMVIEVTFKEIMGMTADYEIVNKESVPNLNKTVLKLQRRSLFEDR